MNKFRYTAGESTSHGHRQTTDRQMVAHNRVGDKQ